MKPCHSDLPDQENTVGFAMFSFVLILIERQTHPGPQSPTRSTREGPTKALPEMMDDFLAKKKKKAFKIEKITTPGKSLLLQFYLCKLNLELIIPRQLLKKK